MSKLSSEKLVEIKKLFDKFDTNENDTLDWDEFCNMVDEMDIEVSIEQKAKIYDKLDSNHTGMISFEEFTRIWEEKD